MRISSIARLAPALLGLLFAANAATADDVPTPESILGFRPGADFKLATWEDVARYCQAVDAASDRVVVRTLGETTEGRPFLVAIVSSAETIADLERYRELQAQVADPRRQAGDPGELAAQSKPVVLITGSIHSSETASTLMATELLHGLATGGDPATREILDNAILLLVPSVNPDGVTKVAEWYGRSLGTPWEGSGMPELYHKYAGHDTNRDWFMLNLKETRLLTGLLYREWFPTITYDVHQMGSRGARLFVPPFFDPVNPNLDPRISQSIGLVGAHMAADLAAAGKQGVLTNAMYDNWWNGGNRTVPQRHNMVGVLTEAASVRLASPIFLEKSELRGQTRGFNGHEPAVNFVDPWPGGWWRLRDIVEYELVCCRSVLTLAARYRGQFQKNYGELAANAIEAGKSGPPYGWFVPADGDDPGRAAALVERLDAQGIDILRLNAAATISGRPIPAGSWFLPAAQPYRAHLKDLMERQQYPDRRTAGGAAEPPYDVAGWTLPLQMGVEVIEADEPIPADLDATPLESVEPPAGAIVGAENPTLYMLRNRADDDVIVVNALLAAGVSLQTRLRGANLQPSLTTAGETVPGDAFVFRADDAARFALKDVLPRVSSQVVGLAGSLPTPTGDLPGRLSLGPVRLGVYQPWVPSMDEGWTRLVLENFGFPYATIHNAEIRAGGLNERFDTILIPSIGPRTLRNGFNPDETESKYVGGLGPEGAAALREFVSAGGTLICLEDSCPYAIAELDLPLTEVLDGLPTSQFYGPGSILSLKYEQPPMLSGEVNDAGLLLMGMPEQGSAYFDRSLAFDVKPGGESKSVKVAARFAPSHVLESGWLLGPEKIQGKIALASIKVDSGRVVLFAFPPQHRGQSRATFRPLFNAILMGGAQPDR